MKLKRLFKPIYKKNCNWCKHLRFGLDESIADCTITGEKMLFIYDVLDNKTCENFKCCTSSRSIKDIVKNFFNIKWYVIQEKGEE